MSVTPRYCPGCGGTNPDVTATHCRYCQRALAPVGAPDPRNAVRCGACLSHVVEAPYCSACGVSMHQHPPATSTVRCPGCNAEAPMALWSLAPSPYRPDGLPIHGCQSCGGVWIDRPTLEAILASAARAAPSAGHGTGAAGVRRRTMAPGTVMGKVVYRKCPACNHSMLRKNFAKISGVLVDVCGKHGTYFDAGELEAVLDFVRSGGLALSERQSAADQAREARQRAAVVPPAKNVGMGPAWLEGGYRDDSSDAFFRWAGSWIRNMFRT